MTKNTTLKSFDADLWFYLFISLHLIVWTFVPALVRDNLPLDSIEGTIWGHQLELGYDKNPFLNGWLTALATHFSQHTGWMVYLFSQISVVACFWAVWQVAKKMLSPAYALISVMMLEGIQYYNFHAIDFNDNTLELGTWGLAIYFFYKALREPNKWSWIGLGFFAGLGMMAKYYTAALLAGMALFLIIDPNNRKQLRSLPPYLGLLTFLAIIIPHIVWLFFHNFITIKYVFLRASSAPSWTNHVFFPVQFTWQQFQAFLPAIVLSSLLYLGKQSSVSKSETPVTMFDKTFLLYVGLAPLLLTVLLSILLGIKLRAGWGMPLLSLWGIIFIATIRPQLSLAKMYRFISAIFILQIAMISAYSFSLIDSSDASSANFPGRKIADVITHEWHMQYHTPLKFVAGSRWVGGNIEFYSPDHPGVYIEWNKQRAPWVDLNTMQKDGAVFVWSITDNESMPKNIQQQYPQLSKPKVLEFGWLRNKNHLEPIKIGIAFLPPIT